MATAQATSNKATFRRFHDAMNTGNLELIAKTIDEIVDPDVIISTPLPVEPTGRQALKEVFRRLHRAFPDLHITVEDLIADGDKVAGRNTVTGTHQHEYMGLPPTDKSIKYSEIFIFRFVNGRIAETWGVVDVFSQMKQLGVIPKSYNERLTLTAAATSRSPVLTAFRAVYARARHVRAAPDEPENLPAHRRPPEWEGQKGPDLSTPTLSAPSGPIARIR